MNAAAKKPWSRKQFEKKIREKEKYYHINHEFHVLMNSGKLDKPAIQGWVANRFYYQVAIPVKDAAIMSNCWDRDVRRHWIQRIIDHDGTQGDEGGIEAWLLLGEAVGLKRGELWSHKHLLPGVKFAIDAYVNFARQQPWEVAASSSLTELFAPTIHQRRLDNWPQYYPWIDEKGYNYFRKRLKEARRDVQHGLDITLDYYKTREQQERMLTVLQFKLDVLWTMLDCMWMAYIEKKPPYHNC
ncbi:MAG: pyrroloquinoline quinone biosynthesis protein PqqC [Gammaproteobacteria bacterium RBG_16_51_14]|nr:MAG: pyrroloquinoline quinone biosynthesis protein PqqC [Gammaproteobacteria bacterium RBG_16_51_14]